MIDMRKHFNSDWSKLIYSGASVQIVNVAAYPILASLYSPAQFGVFSTISALAVSLGSFLMLRTDAMFQVVSAEEEPEVLKTSIFLLLAMSMISIFIFFLLNSLAVFDASAFSLPIIFSIAVAAILNSLFNLSRQIYAKTLRYKPFAIILFIRSIVTIMSQLFFYFYFLKDYGLIAGMLVGLCFSAIMCWPYSKVITSSIVRQPVECYRNACVTFKKYKGFLIRDSLSTILSSGVNALTFVAILSIFGATTAGVFAIAQRLIFMPVTLVAGSVSTFVFQRMSAAFRDGGDLLNIYIKSLLASTVFCFVFCAAVVQLLPIFVTVFFGSEWSDITLYAFFLLPLFFTTFVIGVIGATPLVFQRADFTLGWNLYRATSLLICVVFFKSDIKTFVIAQGCLSLIGMACYLYLLAGLVLSKPEVENEF